MSNRQSWFMMLLGFILVISSVLACAQDPSPEPSKKAEAESAKDQSAQMHHLCMSYLVASFPAFQQALNQQMKDGNENEGVTNWLILLRSLNEWPADEKAMEKEKIAAVETNRKKHEETTKWLSEQDTAGSATANPQPQGK